MTMNHQKWHPTWCVLLLSALVLATDSDDWVDPNDMEFRNTKTTKRPSDIAESKDLSMISNALKLEESPKKITNPEAKFLQRHVARLLTAFKLKRKQILDYSRTPVKAKTVVVWDATSIASLITYDKLAKNETQNHKRITMLHAVEKAFEELFKDVTFFNEDRLESESMTGNIFHSMAKSILDNVWLTLPIVVSEFFFLKKKYKFLPSSLSTRQCQKYVAWQGQKNIPNWLDDTTREVLAAWLIFDTSTYLTSI